MKKVKLAVLVSALAATSVVFAQQTPPKKPAAVAQGAPAGAAGTPGGMSTGAGSAAAGTVGAVTPAGLFGVAAAAGALVVINGSGVKH